MSRKGSTKYADGARPAIAAGIPLKVVEVLIQLLAVEETQITRDARLVEDLGADSLDVVEISMLLEEEYGVAIDDQAVELMTLGTVKDLLSVLERRGVKVQAGKADAGV
jgi:acyl carrier protein